MSFQCFTHLLILSQVIFIVDGKYTAEKVDVQQRRLFNEKKTKEELEGGP